MQEASEDRYGLLYQRVFPGALEPWRSSSGKTNKNKLLVEEKHANTASRDCLQNQILTKGLSIILDEIQKHEGETQDVVDLLFVHEWESIIKTDLFPSGERQLFVLAQVWDRFFTEILPTLQAILYPLQVNLLVNLTFLC